MMADPAHLFVYGLLRRRLGHRMGRLLQARAVYVGEGVMDGRLYDLGPFPGAVPGPPGRGEVRGEVYRLGRRPRLLAALDAYEACGPDDPEPHVYERRPVAVRLAAGGTLDAWIYVYKGHISGLRRVPGGDYPAYRLRH